MHMFLPAQHDKDVIVEKLLDLCDKLPKNMITLL